ncbi:MAG TPA: metal ABC transporter substrate-binding protein, partial [Candidatus Dorea intestinavium]|nr:metal ABC transporter substrate-binding protein [Candidatus Dorea intestinavium]
QNKGTDMHSYQPSVKDMAQISDADLLIYMGGVSDSWMEEAKANVVNEKQVSLNVMEVLKENLKAEDHDHEEGEIHDHEEKDEHIWLSLLNASKVCEAMTEKLVAIDPTQQALYEKNAKAYLNKLENLDKEYQLMRENARKDTLVFGDRFPFIYLLDDYHIHYAAAFPGCEAETGASFETIVSLAKKIDDLKLNDIVVLENSDKLVAKAINENTKEKNKKIVTLDSMQSVTDRDIKAGETYLGIMEENLAVLKQVLN